MTPRPRPGSTRRTVKVSPLASSSPTSIPLTVAYRLPAATRPADRPVGPGAHGRVGGVEQLTPLVERAATALGREGQRLLGHGRGDGPLGPVVVGGRPEQWTAGLDQVVGGVRPGTPTA